MERNEVHLIPEVEAFIDGLPYLLQDLGYKINEDYADSFVDEILDFIYEVPDLPSYSIKPEFAHHFERYGSNLRYVFWKRGNTTWYVFFKHEGNRYIVTHISNNWTEGQYIR